MNNNNNNFEQTLIGTITTIHEEERGSSIQSNPAHSETRLVVSGHMIEGREEGKSTSRNIMLKRAAVRFVSFRFVSFLYKRKRPPCLNIPLPSSTRQAGVTC